MLTVDDARALSNKNGRDKKISMAIEQVEQKILSACEEGRNYIVFGLKEQYGGVSYSIEGKFEKLPEVREHFLKQGFTFKDTGYIQGVYQHTERMYW